MKPLWVIQSTCQCSDFDGMIEAIKFHGLNHEMINVIPFDYKDILDVDYDGPIIPYGGTRFIDQVRKTKKWLCWFNDNFQYVNALEHYGKNMFNSDASAMKMKDFNPSQYLSNQYLFIRPNLDLKEFAGETITPEDFMEWYQKIKGQGWEVGEETDIIVAQASKIDNEWRIFVVDSEPVTGSLYRKNHRLTKDSNVPDEVYDFVKRMIKIWTPSEVFVMDICSLNGELYVLELGGIHSAGFYLSDKNKIIGSVSKFAEKLI